VGNYHRPIYQGTYNLTYSAPGYVSQTISGITAVDGATVIQNVTLSPAAPQVNFTTASTNICGGNAQFTDLTGSATAWHWSFGDGNSSTQQNPAHSYTASGTYTVKLIAENCAGRDSLTQTNYITVTIPEAPTAQTVTACAPATLNLSATASGTVNWYSAATGGNPLATAANYTTPTLTSSTTYYLENEITGTVQHLGAANNTIGTGNFYTGANYNYLRFTATNSFKLLSVLVNANTAGSRTIELRNSANTVLQTKTVNIPAGSSRVILNFNIPVGTNMQLGVAGANGLYRNNAGAAFPYTINNIVSITGNSANNTVSYYYFYDWEITKPCVSPRVPLLVTINQNANTPTITEASGILTSSAATGNQWYNSLTGIIAGATATSYTPTANGTYYVLQTDANGCVSNASNSINFSLTTTENLHENATAIAIYPNPTSGECKIDLSNLKSFERSFATKIVLYNVLGEEVFSMKTIEKIATLTIKNQAKGMYLVKIFDENNQYIGLGKINLN
jgi:PKD repeat protein